jgi:outer membrane protein assembly factor BamB
MENERTRSDAAPQPEYRWGATPGGAPVVAWEYTARRYWAQVLPDRTRVLVAEPERLRCLKLADGELLWETNLPDLPDELVADEDGILLAVAQDVLAVDAVTGTVVWSRRLGGSVTALAADRSRVYAATEGPFFALDRGSGESAWRGPRTSEAILLPQPGGELVVVHSRETLQGYESSGGRRLWEFYAEGQPLVPGASTGDLLLFAGHAWGAGALDLRSGTTGWRLETGGTFEQPPVTFGDLALCTDGSIHAVDAAAGERRWISTPEEQEGEPDPYYAAHPVENALLADTWRGHLARLDIETGGRLWRSAVGQVQGLDAAGDRVCVRANITEGENHWLAMLLDVTTGDLRWELRARRPIADVTTAGNRVIVELRAAILALEG